jgi:hypothetical protein
MLLTTYKRIRITVSKTWKYFSIRVIKCCCRQYYSPISIRAIITTGTRTRKSWSLARDCVEIYTFFSRTGGHFILFIFIKSFTKILIP